MSVFFRQIYSNRKNNLSRTFTSHIWYFHTIDYHIYPKEKLKTDKRLPLLILFSKFLIAKGKYQKRKKILDI